MSEKTILDSDLDNNEALSDNPSFGCPFGIKKFLVVVPVTYRGSDERLHCGQIVVHQDLVRDIRLFFEAAKAKAFPIHSVIPISHPRFSWDDYRSMEVNNTSGFNYRPKTGKPDEFSSHALGRAIDINPLQNPHIKNGAILPHGATYDSKVSGTITRDSFIVEFFESHGWTWGGRWESLKDYQHFEKPEIE
ncbi:MAG: M15 family metallopeptidase [Patescibacteria group bacterium]